MPAPRITCCSVLPWAESAGGTTWRVGWTGAGWPVAMRVGTPVATVVGTVDDGVAVFAALPPYEAASWEISRVVAAADSAARSASVFAGGNTAA